MKLGYDPNLALLANEILTALDGFEGEDHDAQLIIERILAPVWKDRLRVDKLDALLRQDPFEFRIKWDNHNDSGVYVFGGNGEQVGHSQQKARDDDDTEDVDGLTLRAAIDNSAIPE